MGGLAEGFFPWTISQHMHLTPITGSIEVQRQHIDLKIAIRIPKGKGEQ